MFRRATLSVITDEVSDDFEEALRFAKSHRLKHVELRSAGGTNLLRMSDHDISKLRQLLDSYDIKAIALASPLLKWPCDPQKASPDQVRMHGFELAAGEWPETFIRRAFEICKFFEIKRLRVFSFLRAPRPDTKQLSEAFAMLINLAEEHDVQILVEHESVCHVASVSEVDQFLSEHDSPRIKLLLDPGNFLEAGESLKEVPAKWLSRIGHMHVKDYAPENQKFVPLGEGEVPFESCLADLPKCTAENIAISLETHCPDVKVEATAKSLAELRRILSSLEVQMD